MSERLGNLTVDDGAIITDGDGSGGSGGSGGSDGGNVIDPSSVEPPKRGRGRPRKSDDGSGGAGKSSGTGNTTRAAAAKTQKTAAVSVDALAFIINMVGGFIAAKTKQEMLQLDGDESKLIAEAAANVAKHYNVPVTEKAAAWIALMTCVGTIYGSKIAAIKIDNVAKRRDTQGQ